MFVCMVQVAGSDGGKGRKTRGGLPVEEDRMDRWSDRTPRRGGRIEGKWKEEGTQDVTRTEW